jgi:hypothetical protein
MASPVMTHGAQAGALASQALAAGASTTFVVDSSTKLEAQIQIKNSGGATVSATNGCQVQAFRRFGAGPVNDTVPVTNFAIDTVASTASYQSFALPTGRYLIKLTNLDTSNAITVEATLSTVDGIT